MQRICEKAQEHLPVRLPLSEGILREFGVRTKRFFLHSVVKQLLDKYILTFDRLSEHLYSCFDICLVLDTSKYDLSDMIDGVYQIYEKTSLM